MELHPLSHVVGEQIEVDTSKITDLCLPSTILMKVYVSSQILLSVQPDVYNNNNYCNYCCNNGVLQDYTQYTAPHPLKSREGGSPVVVAPLVLLSDDTSGNRSRKWNKFDSWSLSLDGLPQNESRKLFNIHFLSCSNSVATLDMAGPTVYQQALEKGIDAYHAELKTIVLLSAPIMLMCADNPRHSEILNLMGANARKFCRIMVRKVSCV